MTNSATPPAREDETTDPLSDSPEDINLSQGTDLTQPQSPPPGQQVNTSSGEQPPTVNTTNNTTVNTTNNTTVNTTNNTTSGSTTGARPCTRTNQDLRTKNHQKQDRKPSQEYNGRTESNIRKPFPNRSVCRYYMKGICKFGRSGKNCPFNHPDQRIDLCEMFIKDGNGEHGCKQGRRCKYVHPQICTGSWQKRECLKTHCNLPHLKGTVRTNTNIRSQRPSYEPTHTPGRDNSRPSSYPPTNPTKPQYSTALENNSAPAKPQDFQVGQDPQEYRTGLQEIQAQMREIQKSIAFLMGVMKPQIETPKILNPWMKVLS